MDAEIKLILCTTSFRRAWELEVLSMRHRDPHDDPPSKRRPQPYRGPPVTLGHIRSHGVHNLLICCTTGLCHHSAVINADCWPDDIVLLDLDRRAVCTKCGMIGADVRPNWCERPQPESLTGKQGSAGILQGRGRPSRQ